MDRRATLSIAELIQDFTIYPRHQVDSSHISNMANALRAGFELPAIIVCAKSKRIVDGFNRTEAHRQAFGDESKIKCILREYDSETDLVKDAVGLNALHGKQFTSKDRTRCVFLMRRHGISEEEIPMTLRTTKEHVDRIVERIHLVKSGDDGGDLEPRPTGETWRPRPGEAPRVFTLKQDAVVRKSCGWHVKQTLTHLCNELEAEVHNLDDQGILQRFWRLHDLIAVKVPRPVVEEEAEE